MNDFQPRPTLPESWAEKSHCPICGMIPLWVLHQHQSPDEMNCPRCGTAFRVERAGQHLYLTQTPPGYQQQLGERWLLAKDIRAYAQRHPWQPGSALPSTPAPASEQPAVPPSVPLAAAPPLIPSPLVTKARELHALGNSRASIRTILLDTEDTNPSQVEEVLKVVFQDVEKKNVRQNRILLIVGVAVLLLCVCALLATFILRNLSSSVGPLIDAQNPTQSAPNPDAGLRLPFLPDAVENMLPLLAGDAPIFPTPQVVQGSPTTQMRPTCPLSADEAAGLFGGKAAGWTQIPDPPSWYFVALTPADVYVPMGMTGQILILGEGAGSMESVAGPAAINQTNMVIIMCE